MTTKSAEDIIEEIGGYEYGEDFGLDEVKTDTNLKKVIKGMDKNLNKATKLKGGRK